MDNHINQISGGEAVLSVTLNRDEVQISNYSANSFQITNTGNKKIAKVVLNVTNALYPDTVFDPFGQAGDTASKPLTINTNGGTGVVAPSKDSYIGAGGKKGYEEIELLFDEKKNGGFQPGETIGFSIDMDANSVAGSNKSKLDGGSSPKWDVGGVSGAELIGSIFTVTFTDGTTAKGQLQGNNNQAGAQALASQNIPNIPVSLSVNGLNEGNIGTYNANDPKVIIQGAAGKTARVVLTKGFIQPVEPYAKFLEDQLNVLRNSPFPANNAVEFQTVDIKLTGGNQDITNLFNFSGVKNYNFAGEDKLPLGFVASIIDPKNKSLPIGEVTKPIYLEFQEGGSNSNSQVAPIITTAASISVPENQTDVLNINAIDTNGDKEGKGLKYSLTGGADKKAFKINPDNGALSFATSSDFENPQDADKNNVYQVEVAVTDSTNRSDKQLLRIEVDDINENVSNPDPQTGNPLKIEAEDITKVTGYRLENIGVASGGKVLSLVGKGRGEVGTASFTFEGASDNYNVILGTFDENDGQARFEVTKNNSLLSITDLNQNLGSKVVNNETKVERTVATGIAIANGDHFTIKGIEVGSEHARFDFISFEPVDKVTPKPSITDTDNDKNSNTIRFEAEDADTLLNYRQENISAASGNKVLSFFGQGKNESGSATFNFSGKSNAYDLIVGAFDEGDGLASFSIELNDAETGKTTAIATLELDRNLGSNLANSQSFISPTVALGVYLTPGDSLTVHGFENGFEHARLDYLELIPHNN